MVSMSEFLSGFEHQGTPVIQQGPIDPSRRRPGLAPVGVFGDGEGRGSQAPQFDESGKMYQWVETGELNEDGSPIYERDYGTRDQLSPAWGHGAYGYSGGELNLDPSDFVFGGPEIFARLLQSAEMDGGFLSDASQNAQFAAETSGLMGQLGSASRDRSRAASAANLNPIFAERQNINAQYDALSGILGRRAGLQSELAGRQFGAQTAFANILAETDYAEKTFKVNTQTALTGAQIGADAAVEAGKAAGEGASDAGLYAAGGAILGALI